MSRLGEILRGLLAAVVLLALSGAVLLHWWRHSEDRPALLVRWLITLATLLFLAFIVGPLVSRFDYAAAFVGIPLAAVAGAVMAVVWSPAITEYAGRKFVQLYDGGDVPPDPEPCFSVAESRRKTGRFTEAADEVRQQLERFPTHFRGWMLLAQIQAEDLHDLPAAAATIDQLVNQPGHPAKNLAFALTCLADWHLKCHRDVHAARAAFERIVERFPDSEEAHFAHQRIAHLAAAEETLKSSERPPIPLPHIEEKLGLRPDFAGFRLPPPDVEAKAAALVQQLKQYPYDNQAREDLALLYASEFHRVDLATDQLEQLIAQVHAPEKQIVQWLNLLADVQVRAGGNVALARQTVQRIIDRFPESPAAETAHRRLATMNLEARANTASHVIPLGSSEANSRRCAEP